MGNLGLCMTAWSTVTIPQPNLHWTLLTVNGGLEAGDLLLTYRQISSSLTLRHSACVMHLTSSHHTDILSPHINTRWMYRVLRARLQPREQWEVTFPELKAMYKGRFKESPGEEAGNVILTLSQAPGNHHSTLYF
ncbi:uncharacterized protein LOC144381506 [Halichoerus grypus]